MFSLPLLVVSLSAITFVNGVGFRGLTFKGLEEPEPANPSKRSVVKEEWIEQPLDHFNHRDNRTWSMRYYKSDEFFNKNSPIFITIGGEWAISTGFLEGGLMYEIAAAHGGMMYYTEHRYYGKSKPTKDIKSASLQYLNVDQALADLAYFIETKKKELGVEHAPVIVFGGSYAGNMAAWARLKYPHLIQGALASSAPVFAKADFIEYYEVVARSLGRHDLQCVIDTKEAFESVEELLASENGPQKLKEYFNLCDEPDINSISELGYLMNTFTEVFASIVQYDNVVNGKTKIAVLCEQMTSSHLGSPLQRLAHLVVPKVGCLNTSYTDFVKTYADESWPAANNVLRQWYHQTCTEYGYFQTTNSKKSAFGTLVPLQFFTDMCIDLYGEYYNSKFLDSRVRRTNIVYGGKQIDITKVIFTNGDIDPWHSLSVLEDLNETSPAILISGSSHCRDLYSDVPTDSEDLKNARARVKKIIAGWLSAASA